MNLRIELLRIITTTALLGTWSLAGAHGHEHDDGAYNVSMHTTSAQPASTSSTHAYSDGPQSYFGYTTDTGLIYAHIIFMVIAWIFVLPLGTFAL